VIPGAPQRSALVDLTIGYRTVTPAAPPGGSRHAALLSMEIASLLRAPLWTCANVAGLSLTCGLQRRMLSTAGRAGTGEKA
jgi:hypothetical protein